MTPETFSINSMKAAFAAGFAAGYNDGYAACANGMVIDVKVLNPDEKTAWKEWLGSGDEI